MRFDQFIPSEKLQPYIKHFVISENELENEYRVLPSSGLVIGFQYSGRLSTVKDGQSDILNASGITGITDSYRVFRNSAGIGTVLVYFTETGFAHFSMHPTNELFNQSVSLSDLFDRGRVHEVEDKLALATTDRQRIAIVERFLLSQLRDIQTDRLVVEAVRLIYQRKGDIRIRELNEQLAISQSPFEKRFRKVVGTSPKKFASIIRFNAVLQDFDREKSLIDICYEHNFFDQAHFIKDFKKFTGDTPENYKRFL